MTVTDYTETEFPLVNKLLKQVIAWRNSGANWEERYKGVTKTTKELLKFWFEDDHELQNGQPFTFYPVQRPAIETLIYLVEILKVEGIAGLVDHYWDDDLAQIYETKPEQGDYPKYCYKMATGSGKTFIMTFAIVWSFFNYLREPSLKDRVANAFLVIAPNKIVYKRLLKDLLPISNNNSIFSKFPFVPQSWFSEFDVQFIYRSELSPTKAKGVVFLTNVQQLYTKIESINAIIKKAGTISGSDYQISKEEFLERTSPKNPLFTQISQCDNLVIINDEAHHVHSDYLSWNRTIQELNKAIKSRNNANAIKCQLDFSATPRYQGQQQVYFEHIIFDYPLPNAINDRIVKIPRIGKLTHIRDVQSDNFGLINQDQIQAGMKIREEYEKLLSQLGKKSVLFIMADKNQHADEVYRFLVDEQAKFGYTENQILLIHTKERGSDAGELLEDEEDELMKDAEEIDAPDNPYKIIISVMMLKEGWDVRSVQVIVPLRSFKSQILVEQTLGRGLRKQISDQDEYLTVIEHERFEPLIREALQKDGLEDKCKFFTIDAQNVNAAIKPGEVLVFPESNKKQFDMEIPILSGGSYYQTDILGQFPWQSLPDHVFKLDEIEVKSPKYYEMEYGKDEIIREMELDFSFFQTINDYIVFITKKMLKKFHISEPPKTFLPNLKKYLQARFFNEKVDFDQEIIMQKLNHPLVVKKIYEILNQPLTGVTITYKEFQKSNEKFRISETPLQFISQIAKTCKKTIFNYIVFDSDLEEAFARYLDKDPLIKAFCKISAKMHFYLYYNDNGFLRRYIPDFFVLTTEGKYYLVETKGDVLLDKESTKAKSQIALDWVRKAGEDWAYLFIEEKAFYDTYQKISFKELANHLADDRR